MYPNNPQNDAVFWELWENNRKILFKKCLQIMNGDFDEAEDALSSAMLKAREKMLLNCGLIRNFKKWALRLTENVCIDVLRRQRKFVRYAEFPDSLAEKSCDDYSFMESETKHQSRESALDEIIRMVDDLHPRLRGPFLLRFFLNEPYRDIAGRFGITEENARKRIQEARSHLKFHHGSEMSGLLAVLLRERDIEPQSYVALKMRRYARSAVGDGESEVDVPRASAWIVDAPRGNCGGRNVLAFLPLKSGRLEKRLQSFLRYVAKHPGGWKMRLELAQIFYALGKLDLAERQFRNVLARHPRSFTAWTLLGGMLMDEGRGDEAADLFREAGLLAYRDSSRKYLSGMSDFCRGRIGEAFMSFKTAGELEPSNISFRHAMGICMFRSGLYGEAHRHFEDILIGRPGDIVSLAYCCEASLISNRLKDAGKYIDVILRNNPYDCFALKKNEELEKRTGIIRAPERERLRRLMKRLERVKLIIGEAGNEKMPEWGAA